MKIQTAVYFNFMHMEGCASISKADWGLGAYEGRVGLDLENAPFVPE